MDSCDIRTAVSLEMQSWWGNAGEPQSAVASQAGELPAVAHLIFAICLRCAITENVSRLSSLFSVYMYSRSFGSLIIHWYYL